MIKASVIGATGYAGVELIKLLVLHPHVELVCLTSQSYAGQKIQDVYPHLRGFIDLELQIQDADKIGELSDVVFLALPHGHAVSTAEKICALGKKVIDLGADLRFRDAKVYEDWYHVKHENPLLSREAVYGLPEINRERIRKAQITGSVQSGSILIDGLGIGDVGNIVLRDRKHLSEDGLIVVVAVLNSKGKVVCEPDVISRGFVYVKEAETLMDEMRVIAKESIEKGMNKKKNSYNAIKNSIKDELGSYVYQKTKRKPMILPVIIEIPS
jgi:hypothetical protein